MTKEIEGIVRYTKICRTYSKFRRRGRHKDRRTTNTGRQEDRKERRQEDKKTHQRARLFPTVETLSIIDRKITRS